jgi:uncharacterized protein YdiU (UPF0061 family)
MIELLTIKNDPRFSKELPADSISTTYPREVIEACFSFSETKKPGNPELIHLSEQFLLELGLKVDDKEELVKILSGADTFQGFKPYAMCYGGHQFGNWAGQLGDGRAINIAELPIQGKNWKLQLKGSGPTPYSRGSDGLAVLRSSIREYLCSEAMHNLGVPTTRALSLVKSGDLVSRDILYNGNPKDEQGAIVCRAAESFIRFGSFEIFSARGDKASLKKLVDYTIKHHYSQFGEPNKASYLQFFKEVVNRTLEMIIHWQRVGFVHGVMNTDNMSIMGLTIDYGPYGWLENFDPEWTPNTTDSSQRRYRFGNQHNVALWNLTQLANALYPLIEEVSPLEEILDTFKAEYLSVYHKMMANKLGIFIDSNASPELISDLKDLMSKSEIDMTIFYRQLSNEIKDFNAFSKVIQLSSYQTIESMENQMQNWKKWFDSFQSVLASEKIESQERILAMRLINPKYVLRNYMAQLAIDDAEKNDYKLLDELYQLLKRPYDEQAEMEKWFAKRPDWAKNKVGCSMLSCSS